MATATGQPKPYNLFGPPQDNGERCGMKDCTGDVCNQKGLYCVTCLCAPCKRSKCVTAIFLREAHSW